MSNEPQLTVTTLIFPENVRFNTGSSLERWSRKCPPLVGGKGKCPSPPHLEGERDFYSPHFMEEPEVESRNEPETIEQYVVTSDIESLMMQSERNVALNTTKKRKGKKKKSDEARHAQKRHKTVKVAVRTRPPSPATEQIIRVDVTTSCVTSFDSDDSCDVGAVEPATADGSDDDFVLKCKQLALTRKPHQHAKNTF